MKMLTERRHEARSRDHPCGERGEGGDGGNGHARDGEDAQNYSGQRQ